MVQERRADFQRGRHAGAIHLGQDVARQPGRDVGKLRLQDGIRFVRILHHGPQGRERVVSRQLRA